jgi:hypothetical protein
MLRVSLPKSCFPFHPPFARRYTPGLRLSIKVRWHELVFCDQKTASNASEYSDFSKASMDMVSYRIRNVTGSNPQCCFTEVRTRTSTTDEVTVYEHSGGNLHFSLNSSKCVEVLPGLSYGSTVLHDDTYKLKSWWSSFPSSSSFSFSSSFSSPFRSHSLLLFVLPYSSPLLHYSTPPPRGLRRWCVSPQKHVWISVQALFTMITQMWKCPNILIIK